MALSEYQTFATPPLEFPINGKTYRLEPLGIAAGLKLADALTDPESELNDLKGAALWKLLLGDIWDQFIEDGVPVEAATRAGITALADHQEGRAYAEVVWETGADPKALEKFLKAKAPNRAARRSPATAKASTTKRPASTSTTKTSRAR
jgi:hypothetical protein